MLTLATPSMGEHSISSRYGKKLFLLQVPAISEGREQDSGVGRRVRLGREARGRDLRGERQNQRQRLSRDDDVGSGPSVPLLAPGPAPNRQRRELPPRRHLRQLREAKLPGAAVQVGKSKLSPLSGEQKLL